MVVAGYLNLLDYKRIVGKHKKSNSPIPKFN